MASPLAVPRLEWARGLSWSDDLIAFWFGLDPAQWWDADGAFDDLIRQRFADLHKEKRTLPAVEFLGDPRTALAAVILFDQFPRNMSRGHADQFATDSLALAIATESVDRKFDDHLDQAERAFIYMPFMHSEDRDAQRRSLLLFTALGDDSQLGFAKKHHDIIARFGRFPHRNEVLGRTPRPDEVAAGDVVPW